MDCHLRKVDSNIRDHRKENFYDTSIQRAQPIEGLNLQAGDNVVAIIKSTEVMIGKDE